MPQLSRQRPAAECAAGSRIRLLLLTSALPPLTPLLAALMLLLLSATSRARSALLLPRSPTGTDTL